MSASYVHEISVRYAEVDLQGVVFNAHYLTWVDDAMSGWLAAVGYQGASWATDGEEVPDDERGWDVMVRHAEIDWVGSAGFGDVVRIGCSVPRWGRTSFDVRYEVAVGDQPVAVVVLTYVGVRRDEGTGAVVAAPVPERFRRLLSAPADDAGT